MLRRQASEEEELRFLQEARVLGQLADGRVAPRVIDLLVALAFPEAMFEVNAIAMVDG